MDVDQLAQLCWTASLEGATASAPSLHRCCRGERQRSALPPSPGRLLGEGVEYLLADSQPPHLFILRKLYRHGGGGTGGAPAITTLAFYYILDGSVYQAPSLQAALQARMVRGWFEGGARGAGTSQLPRLVPLPPPAACRAAAHRQPVRIHTPSHLPQQRCMFSLKSAFRDMQRDLAPLAQGAWLPSGGGGWVKAGRGRAASGTALTP